jgi:capreomycidine synthase
MAAEVSDYSGRAEKFRDIAPALLERWMRDYYFETEYDLGSSGVESFSLADLIRITKLTEEEIKGVVFDDSRTQGGPALREAIAEKWAGGDPGSVMVTHGSSEAIYLVMQALLRPGDEVVALEPCYQQLVSIAENLGCHLKRWKLRYENKFVPDIDELKRILTPRTRAVVVNFPHNPCGVSVSAQQQKALVEAAASTGAYLIWDAAFSEILYDARPLPYPNSLYERAVTLGTLSKAYGLAGLRVGWFIAPPELISCCIHLRDYTTLHLSPLVELIARRAIESGDKLVNNRLEQARKNLAIARQWASDYTDFVEWIDPQGGVCAFPRLKRIDDAEPFCRELAVSGKVLLVPGNCFNHPSHVRFGFGGDAEKFVEGLARLTPLLVERSRH